MKPVEKKPSKLKAKVVNSPVRTQKAEGSDRPFACAPRADV